jgi:argininosuccinate lyase
MSTVQRPWFVFVESNTSGTGRLFASAARDLGYRPVLLCERPGRYPYAEQDRLDIVVTDTMDTEAVIAACARLAARSRIAGVASSSDYFAVTAAVVAARLGLPGADPDALARCADKEIQREYLVLAGVPVPRFTSADGAAAAVDAARGIGPPVIVKPPRGSGSVGVRLCATGTEVAAHAALLLGRTHNERGMPLPARVLVEEYAVGPEFSVEIMSGHSAGVTAKHLGPPPFQVEVGHDHPADIPKAQRDLLVETALAACGALGLDWGAAHVELRMTARGPVVIEVNARLAGGFIPELVRLARNRDLITELVSSAAGQPIAARETDSRGSAIRFVLAPGDGRLADVTGIDRVRAMPGVHDVAIYREIGSTVTRTGDFRDRIGHVICTGDSTGIARVAVERANAVLCPRLDQAPHAVLTEG